MANFGLVMKEEIRRLAKKEIKPHIDAMRQAIVRQRAEIAQLRQLLREHEKEIALLKKQKSATTGTTAASDETTENPLVNMRYSARSVRAQRKRLKLSADDYGRLVGVSGLTIYNWEHEKSRPRKAQLAGLMAVRQIGRREAIERLKALKT